MTDANLDRPAALDAVAAVDPIETALGAVLALCEECHLSVEDGGIRLSAMDPATVASVEVFLDRAAFDSFDAGTTGLHVGLAADRLAEVVGLGDGDDRLTCRFDPDGRRLDLDVGDLSYSLALLDPATVRDPHDLADLAYAAELTVGADTFGRAVRAADMVSDHLTMAVEDDRFAVEAEGDTDDVVLERDADELPAFDGGDARSLFSLDYLAAIHRAMPRDAEVELGLGTEHPLGIAYEFADGAGTVEYLVAPRISAR